MNNELKGELYRSLGIDEDIFRFGETVCRELKERFERIDETAEYNQLKVLKACQRSLPERHHRLRLQ